MAAPSEETHCAPLNVLFCASFPCLPFFLLYFLIWFFHLKPSEVANARTGRGAAGSLQCRRGRRGRPAAEAAGLNDCTISTTTTCRTRCGRPYWHTFVKITSGIFDISRVRLYHRPPACQRCNKQKSLVFIRLCGIRVFPGYELPIF